MPYRNTIDIMIDAKDRASPKINALSKLIRRVAKLSLGVGGLVGIAYAARIAIQGITNLADRAAKLQGVERAFISISKAAGTAGDKMLAALNKASAGMLATHDIMRHFNLAAMLVSKQFAVELPEALNLLTKVSAATGESMNYLMASLVRGVGRLQPRILDNLGIQIKLSQAYAEYGKEIGKNAKQLTRLEQMTAVHNKTMELLRANTAAMPDLVGTLTHEWAVFRATMINTRDTVAKSFIPVLTNLLNRLNNFGGRVLPTISRIIETRVAPAIDLLIDGLAILGKKAEEAGSDFIKKFGGKMQEAAWNALVWGNNIMVSFADGIVRGAVGALSAAMTFVSNILTYWLKATSPPKVAPDLAQWGAAAFTEYLRGFGEAEFDILEKLQSPLKAALQSLVDMGKLAKEDIGGIFVDTSKILAGAIDEWMKTGDVGANVYDALRAAGGEYGDFLAELAKRQFALAGAVRAVHAAEAQLAAARSAERDAGEKIRDIADEYNRLLAAGADPAILKAKKAEFAAARQAMMVAKEQRKDAEASLETAEDQIDPLKEQLRLQERLINQLIEMTDALKPLKEPAIKLKKGKVVAPEIEIEPPVIPEIDFEALTTSFDEAKEMMRLKLEELLQPWRDKMAEWALLMDPVIKQWDKFKETVKKFYEESGLKDIVAWIKEMIPDDFIEKLGEMVPILIGVAIAWGLVSAAIGIAAGIFGVIATPLGILLTAILVLGMAWKLNLFGMRDSLTEFWEVTAKPALIELGKWLETTLPAAAKTLGDFWENTLLPALKTVWKWMRDDLYPFLEKLNIMEGETLIAAATGLSDFWENTLQPAFESLWIFVRDDLYPLLESLALLQGEALFIAGEALAALWDETILPALKKVWAFLVLHLGPKLEGVGAIIDTWTLDLLPAWETGLEGIGNVLETVKGWVDSFRKALDKLPDFLPDYLTGKSPTPFETGLRGISSALKEISRARLPEFGAGLEGLPSLTRTAPRTGEMQTGTVQNYYFEQTVNTQATQANVMRDWSMARALAGV